MQLFEHSSPAKVCVTRIRHQTETDSGDEGTPSKMPRLDPDVPRLDPDVSRLDPDVPRLDPDDAPVIIHIHVLVSAYIHDCYCLLLFKKAA